MLRLSGFRGSRALIICVALGLGGCFEDPIANDTASGDGDGDSDSDSGTSGDGDGDGDPAENVVVDLFAEACGVTAGWVTTANNGEPLMLTCDQVGAPVEGWMVRYPELSIGDDTFAKVVSITPPDSVSSQVRGQYNLDDVPEILELEFRAEVFLRCPEGVAECIGKFAVALAEGVPGGLFVEADDRLLTAGAAPISVSYSLSAFATFSEPSIVLLGERTDDMGGPSPEVMIVSPRLVLP